MKKGKLEKIEKMDRGLKVSASISREMFQDLQGMHGLNINEELEKILVEECITEVIERIAKDPCLDDFDIDDEELLERMMKELKCETYADFIKTISQGVHWVPLNYLEYEVRY